MLNQVSWWQLGYAIPAGTAPEVRTAGVDVIKKRFIGTLPWLEGRLRDLHNVNQLSDAAHVISPVGGNGINYAIADAAETANQLISVLTVDRTADEQAMETGRAGIADRLDAALPRIESVRRPPVEKAQRLQVRIERDNRTRLEKEFVEPPSFFKLQSAIPGLAKLTGKRTQIAVARPHPLLRG